MCVAAGRRVNCLHGSRHWVVNEHARAPVCAWQTYTCRSHPLCFCPPHAHKHVTTTHLNTHTPTHTHHTDKQATLSSLRKELEVTQTSLFELTARQEQAAGSASTAEQLAVEEVERLVSERVLEWMDDVGWAWLVTDRQVDKATGSVRRPHRLLCSPATSNC